MGEIINTNTAIETQPGGDTGALLDITQSLLADARTALNSSGVLSVPYCGTLYAWCWSLFAHPCVEYCYADDEHRSGWTLYDSQRWCR